MQVTLRLLTRVAMLWLVMMLGGLGLCPPGAITAATATPGQAGDSFPFTLADIKKELGPPTEADEDFVDYRGKLNLRVSPLGHLEVQAATDRVGAELTARFFQSKLFKADEGKAALDLVKAKGGERKAGRFEITAKESTVVNGMVIMKLTTRAKR